MAGCISANADTKQAEMGKIISEEMDSWKIELQPSEGDWVRVYYDEENNVLYSYADLYLARFGLAGQSYYDDRAIWMIEKFGLFGHINMLSVKLYLSEHYKDTKVVVAYVTGGEKEKFEDYYIADVGDIVSAQNKPSVMYSITMENCNNIGETKDMIVYDLFFGETSVITYQEAAPYLQ